MRERHSRHSTLNEDEIAERVRLAVRAAGSRKTGGGKLFLHITIFKGCLLGASPVSFVCTRFDGWC